MFENRLKVNEVIKFEDENRSILNRLEGRMKDNYDLFRSNLYNFMHDYHKSTKSYNITYRSGLNIEVETKDISSKYEENEDILRYAQITEGQKDVIKRYVDNTNENYLDLPNNIICNTYGDIIKHGQYGKDNLRQELEAFMFKNTLLNKEVMEIDKMIYVCLDLMGIIKMYQSDNDDLATTDMDMYNTSVLVEFDALLIRYLSSLNEEELNQTMNSICLIVNDKIAGLIDSGLLESRLMSTYLTEMGKSEVNQGKILLGDLFRVLTIKKIIADSVNGVKSSLDMLTVEEQIRMAMASLNSLNTMFNYGSSLAMIQSMSKKTNIKGKYYEFMSYIIAEKAEKIRNNMQGILNSSKGKYLHYRLLPDDVRTGLMRYNARIGMEANQTIISPGVLKVNDILNISKEKDEDLAIFSFMGTESDKVKNEVLDKIKRCSRAKYLMNLQSKEKKEFLNLENEIMKYQSDIINCKDNVKKNMLLNRSKNIGKLIQIELGRKNNSEEYIELLIMLEDNKHKLDMELSTKDYRFDRNRNLYGQIIVPQRFNY